MASVEFRNVTKQWGAFVGVKDLSLSIAEARRRGGRRKGPPIGGTAPPLA